LWPSYAGDGVGGNTDGADVPLTYLHGDHPGFRPMASSWAAYAKARLVSASVRTADRREPMTFSQREKVPMQLPRFSFGPFRARSSALNLTPLGTKPQWLALR
jgi:hypothetical protein